MPPVSQAQRRAMYAAAEGRSTLGIPERVGKEFIGKDMKRGDWRGLIAGLVKFFTEEEEEPEHKEAEDTAPAGRAASVAFFSPTGKVLLLKRAATEENWPDTWALPGGKADDGEDIAACARRECQEEIGDRPFDGMAEIDRKRTARNWEHVTYAVKAADEFEPKLNGEHTEYRWAPLDDLPEPLHPGVAATLKMMAADESMNEWRREHGYESDLPAFRAGRYGLPGGAITASDMAPAHPVIAYDWASVRTLDTDGRLHVDVANICQAKIDEYLGSEINGVMASEPGWRPLEPTRRYRVLRDPDELAKPETIKSANAIPILSEHLSTSALTHKFEETVGSTGTEAKFEYPFIRNALVFWPQEAIDEINEGTKAQLSPGYRYRIDLTPGHFEGESYEMRMMDIRFNHLAQVPLGRQGARVVVPDADPDWRAWAAIERAILNLGTSSRAANP